MKKSIFFVEAPFQVLSAYEAIPFFSLEDYSLVVRLSGEKANDIQLKQIVNFLFKDNEKNLNISIKLKENLNTIFNEFFAHRVNYFKKVNRKSKGTHYFI